MPNLICQPAHIDSGTIRFSIYKAAFFGDGGGEGTLTFMVALVPYRFAEFRATSPSAPPRRIAKVPCATYAALEK